MYQYLSSNSDDDQPPPRRQRMIRPRINFNLDNFNGRFRLSRNLAENVLLSIGANLQPSTWRNNSIQPRQQLLLTIRFMATNGFYELVGDAHCVSNSTLCRVTKRVVSEITRIFFRKQLIGLLILQTLR